jgi:mycothiol S-conjugate amidase
VIRQRRLLAVFAHADDETLLAGAVLARYAAEGVEVRLLVAAPGGDEDEDRLALAAKALGIALVSGLRYEPSPMWPQPAAVPPRDAAPAEGGPPVVTSAPLKESAPMLGEALLEDIAARIAGRIDDFAPQAVLTHSPYGEYGHPDHIAVHRATVAAFHARPRGEARLYCLAYPLPLVRLNHWLMRLSGKEISRAGPRGTVDIRAAVRAAPRKSGVIDVRAHVAARTRAAAAYAGLIAAGPFPLRMLERSPQWVQRRFFGRAAVTRLIPPSSAKLTGLFESEVVQEVSC